MPGSPAASPAPARTVASLPALAKVSLAVLGAFTVALSCLLWPVWRHNPDLSHGMFMPVIFLLLLQESRARGAQRWLRGGTGTNLAIAAFVIAGLLALGAAGLYAAALGWSHALVNFMLVLTLALLLTAALLNFSTESLRFVPFNWNALVAIGLWLLSAPMPLGTYTRLTLTLQLWVSENVLRALHVLGVAAHRDGNIIELASGSVGVEEACSGVRSLISCVFAGFFFSASFVRRPVARALILLLAAPLALVMNFLRSLTLTLIANAGIDIAGTWHDATGYAVLGITALLLGGLAFALGREPRGASAPIAATDTPITTRSQGSQALLAGGLALAVALVAVFYVNTHPTIRDDRPVPDLLAILPNAVDGWQVNTSHDLYRFASQLQTDHLAQRSYAKQTANGPVEITVYLAYWRAGQTAVSQVASHTPDACWPGAGWQPVQQAVVREELSAAGRTLPTAESRLFKYGEFPQHVWFWHLYDGRPIAYQSPYSPKALLEIAWHYGFHHDGDQLFVRVSSNAPWDAIAREQPLAEFFTNVKSLGL